LKTIASQAATRASSSAAVHTFRHGFASMLIVGLKLDPVNVARQLGHSDPAITLSTYSHLFARARHADEMRRALGDGFGHLLSAESS
jgi:integrase